MRGCVTYGEHISERNFLIGRAVDEAAEYMDLANGAFVWLTPSAEEKLRRYENLVTETFKTIHQNKQFQSFDENERKRWEAAFFVAYLSGFPPMAIYGYEMPIKNGEKLTCSVLNPISQISSKEERNSIIDIYREEMSKQKLDIIIKRQNTMKFLEIADADVDKYVIKRDEQIQKIKDI